MEEGVIEKELVIRIRIKHEEAIRSFKIHLIAYILVNILLMIVNLIYSPWKIWFIYPVIGWGIGLLAHYICGVKYFDKCIVFENK